MPQAVDSIASALEQLAEQLRSLERRVAALEARAENPETEPQATTPAPEPSGTAAARHGFPTVETSSGAVSILGKAVLGMAGAYLLRALAESGTVPKLPVLFLAIFYAGFWMVWAVRIHSASRFASAAYSITSALILSPLLWESTVRFQVLSPGLAALVLVAFSTLAMALAWPRDLQLIPWIATLATVGTALALIIETRELLPLTASLLAVALATEIAACFGHRLSLRAIPALTADFAVWLLVYVMTSEILPDGYHPVASLAITLLCLALLSIYGGSIAARSFVLRHRLSFFEVAQAVAAFLLASYGTLRVTHNAAAPALGAFFLVLSAACYWGALSRFASDAHTRNRRVSATWAAALLLGGSFLFFSADLHLPFLCVAAVAAAFLYTRTSKLSLGLHASFYLAAAALVSPLPMYTENALAGTIPPSPGWRLILVMLAALACYLIGSAHAEVQPKRRLLWIVPAVLVAFPAAALMVVAATALASGHLDLDASRLSVIRTVVNCALAFALGLAGSRWRRIELGWVAYAAVAFGTLKLLFEDLRFGNAASMVVSLLFYGSVLILLPRLTRRSSV